MAEDKDKPSFAPGAPGNKDPAGPGSLTIGAPGAAAARPAGPKLPLFYRRPEALNKERHATLALKADADYRFAGQTNAVPLNAVEFPPALRTHPIVFTGDDPPVPVAILALRPGENAYVDAAGAWQQGVYIPAYVRRYPFVFMASADGKQLALCIDMDSALIDWSGTRRLFDGGEPTDLTKRALEFCKAFQAQSEATKQFSQAIAKHRLLSERTVEITTKAGQKVALRGFRVIDEATLNGLDDAAFLELRKPGWLQLIYAHLISLGNWPQLVERTGLP